MQINLIEEKALQVSTEVHHHQFNVKGVPRLGCSEGGERLYSVKIAVVKQLNCKIAVLWNDLAMTQLCKSGSAVRQLGQGGCGIIAPVLQLWPGKCRL